MRDRKDGDTPVKNITFDAIAVPSVLPWDVCVVRVTAPTYGIAQGTSVPVAGSMAGVGAAQDQAHRDRTFTVDAALKGYPGIRSWSPPV
jgi:hypothetical protein